VLSWSPRIVRTGCAQTPSLTAPPLLLLQEFAYSYRMWITLIKLLYAALQGCLSHADIHTFE